MSGQHGVIDAPLTNRSAQPLRLFQPRNGVVALGLAVNYLMRKAPFDRQPFGDWSLVLVGQIDRGHFCFVAGGERRIQGFAGWGLTTKANAEAWLAGRRDLSHEDCRDGDCVVFNAWAANSFRVHRFMVDHARDLSKNKDTLYFKRYYSDGRVRPVRLRVNEFVGNHISRKAAILPGAA